MDPIPSAVYLLTRISVRSWVHRTINYAYDGTEKFSFFLFFTNFCLHVYFRRTSTSLRKRFTSLLKTASSSGDSNVSGGA